MLTHKKKGRLDILSDKDLGAKTINQRQRRSFSNDKGINHMFMNLL